MEQIHLPLTGGAVEAAAQSAAAASPLPVYLLARLDEECRKPSTTDARLRRLIVSGHVPAHLRRLLISGCVPAYYAPAHKESQRITDALRECNLSLLDGAKALHITLDQMDALERIQHHLSSREILLIVSALDKFAATVQYVKVDQRANCSCPGSALTSAKSSCAHIAMLRTRAVIEGRFAAAKHSTMQSQKRNRCTKRRNRKGGR